MKEQIFEVLREHPNGLRIREISAHTNIDHWMLVHLMYELTKDGIIYSKPVNNMVQGECYNLWFAI